MTQISGSTIVSVVNIPSDQIASKTFVAATYEPKKGGDDNYVTDAETAVAWLAQLRRQLGTGTGEAGQEQPTLWRVWRWNSRTAQRRPNG